MVSKTVKISTAHHKWLKLKGIEHDVTLQEYLAYILELSITDDPEITALRDHFEKCLGPVREAWLARAKQRLEAESTDED